MDSEPTATVYAGRTATGQDGQKQAVVRLAGIWGVTLVGAAALLAVPGLLLVNLLTRDSRGNRRWL